ncbi:MAG TPA: M43 family zinc metalloprotease [Bacteroidia bacterium]|nr:M43 family zinc metalloprotease [Bacteroidia bacterium]
MKFKFLPILVAFLCCAAAQSFGQSHRCATVDVWEKRVQNDPAALARRQQSEAALQNWIVRSGSTEKTAAVITIPVVVHVVYNNQLENISDAQIQSQITVLNKDFRRTNSNALGNGHPFFGATADTEIEFCLATTDPNGNTTTGITRTSTSNGTFQDPDLDNIKFTASGGRDNWDPTSYLNIWVGDLGTDLYGYATFPDELADYPEYDGVVINYTAFGTMGTAEAPANLGRTGSHEVGHWLFLNHIWGDDNCGDDLVADTKPAEDANYDCPGFPYNAFNSCGTDGNGEMYMNYMDYTDDACMNMFTSGQKSRMRGALNGDRSAILSSQGCGGIAAVKDEFSANAITLSPNPSNGNITLDARNFVPRNASIIVVSAMGAEVLHLEGVKSFPQTLDLSALPSDLYFVRIAQGSRLVTKKVVISH